MEDKTLRVLELDKILRAASEFAVMGNTKEKILNLTPFDDIEKARTALCETDEARVFRARQGRPPLQPLGNVSAAVNRSKIGALLSFSELLSVGHILRVSRQILGFFDVRDFEADYPLLNMSASSLQPQKDLERHIFDCIISDEEMDDNASETLYRIRKKKASLANKVKDILNDIIHSPSYSSALRDPIISMRGDRYVVPVKSEARGTIKGVIHDTSSSGGTIFVEPLKVVETNNEIRKLSGEESDEMERIVAELSSEVSENAEIILDDFNALSDIDFIFAKADYADKINACMPLLNEDNIIDIKKGRHPLIDPKKVVPIDVRLGEDFDTLVITGPNTGGKTVSIKTIGLFALMTQCGLQIPAKDGSRMAFFDEIFADIGDEQSIEQSLSTFSSHLVNIVEILKKCGAKSLVLFDELGAGTDPAEGAALATAILKEVQSRGALTAATTHYSEIKMYALSTPRVENAACEFDVNSLKPTYRLYIGALGKSCAFDIAKRLGMDEVIINNASNFMNAENTRFEDIVNTLETDRQKTYQAREEAERSLSEAEKIRERLKNEDERQKKNRERVLDEARREAKKIIDDAKREIDEKIKAAEKAAKGGGADELRRIKGELSKQSGEFQDKLTGRVFETSKKVKPEDIKAGTPLYVPSMNSSGTAVAPPDKNGRVDVEVGGMRIKTNISAVELDLSKPKEEKKRGRTIPNLKRESVAKSEVDLRGMSLEEALSVVDKYIDDAVMSHLNTVTIIHGRGTGVLKKGITDYLKGNKSVSSFRLGKYGEGGDGVTIVEL
ncbi:MAG: endonuclease MutS2 [Clostridia bacterium]|nr:endonuclease MutS2 [Clostridia bacterium]